ncbi:MAG: hypothetical protein WC450_03710 [Candidatus Omnitrophota bacterium]|jgi:hypothetical protein
MGSGSISLNPFSIARGLGTAAFLLVLASMGGELTTFLTGHDSVYGLIPLFCLNAEHNIPTFFSALLLLFAAQLLSVITMLEKKRMAAHVSRWAILSCGFLFMAADELFCFHENMGDPISQLSGNGHRGVFYFAWVIPGIVVVLGLSLFFLRFLLNLPVKSRITFLMAAALYFGGCIGCELIGGNYADLHGQKNLIFGMMTTVEESLEMAGVIIFIWGLLVYIADNYREVLFSFRGVEEKSCPTAP